MATKTRRPLDAANTIKGRPYFVTPGGRQLRRIPKSLPCPNCDGEKISILLDTDEEPYSFQALAQCAQCGTRGPRATRVLGPHGHWSTVEREAAWGWNALSRECMAGQGQRLPAYAVKEFAKIWRRIANTNCTCGGPF